MPPRVSRSSLPSKAKQTKGRPTGSRNPKKAQKRALDAFSIASHDAPDRVKLRQHRFGEADHSSHRKRARADDDEEEGGEDEDEEYGGPKRRKQQRRTAAQDEDIDEGSDSEGNTWTMGHVDEDDDESIDSDDAFGESDEERFEGFSFRGSQSGTKGKKAKKPKAEQDMDDEEEDFDLGEDDSADGEDEDDLGEDAIDLATALDQYEESDEGDGKRRSKKGKEKGSGFDDSDEGPSEGEDVAADGNSDLSSDEDEEDEEDRRAQLKDLISSLPADEDKPKSRRVEIHESGAPSEFGVTRKVDLTGLKSRTADPEKKKALKLLEEDSKPTKHNDIARKLDAPLPKRQQDKLNRAAANEKTNQTLDRWTDTIQQNRRAEHLHFPLKHPDEGRLEGEARLMPTSTTAPANNLESTIQSILQQSGLSNGKDDEEQIQKWEELQTNKLPLEEVMKRRNELRKERELLFREEVRAKRVKKIKSKAYRRVHRKERERLMQRERDALKADGVDISEDEREYNDRRRAEERMGAKHRESKWAKGVKATGKAAWDEDARAGVTEMARRNEELRRRIEGKAIHDENEDRSDFSSEEDSEDDDGDDALQRSLGKVQQNPFSTNASDSKMSKLSQMAFMQRAEEAKRKQNDETIDQIRKELAGEESNSEDEDENAAKRGRRKFGPNTNVAPPAIKVKGSQFEERLASDDEEGERANDEATNEEATTDRVTNKNNGPTLSNDTAVLKSNYPSQNPYLVKAKKEKSNDGKNNLQDLAPFAHDTIASLQESSQPVSNSTSESKNKVDEFLQQRVTAADDDGWATVLPNNSENEDDEDDIENEGIDLDVFTHNKQLTAKAFAGDNVEAEFAAEKRDTIKEEAPGKETNVLPGWGSWTGDGLSKRAKKRKGARTVTHKEGIDPSKRQDAKLDKVIINQKRQRSNVKYMATQLPFPFETKEQYERSLRMPKGQEWVTKRTHVEGTKPRVMVKQGIIKPMRKPMA